MSLLSERDMDFAVRDGRNISFAVAGLNDILTFTVDHVRFTENEYFVVLFRKAEVVGQISTKNILGWWVS